MSIEWDDIALQSFFGLVPTFAVGDDDRKGVAMLDYAGKILRYSFWFHMTDEVVLVSGDTLHPFGADSMYEFSIPCDRVTEIEDSYYPGKSGLGFWYGEPNEKENMTMMLLKRPDGELKVWPGRAWPERHAYFRVHSREEGRTDSGEFA